MTQFGKAPNEPLTDSRLEQLEAIASAVRARTATALVQLLEDLVGAVAAQMRAVFEDRKVMALTYQAEIPALTRQLKTIGSGCPMAARIWLS